MQKDNVPPFIIQRYDDMVRGIDITPHQDRELRQLYARATLPVRPWLFVFAGGLGADMIGGIYTFVCVAKNDDRQIAAGYVAFLVAQFIAVGLLWYRMHNAEKQLRERIYDLRRQNARLR